MLPLPWMRDNGMNELIKKFIALLEAPITPENVLMLKSVYGKVKANSEIRLQKIDNPRIDFLEGRKEWQDIYKPDNATDSGVEIGLLVLDKESIPETKFKRYQLGYALDSTKSFDGDNIVKVLDTITAEDFKCDSVVNIRVKGVEPLKDGKFYKVKIDSPISYTPGKKLNSSKEIIRKAFTSRCLTLDRLRAVDLVKTGILSFDIDKYFGVEIDKTRPIVKASGFMDNGVVYSVVYPVNQKDTDGDYALPEEVQKACWKFAKDYQAYNFMHHDDLSNQDVSMVENACALCDVPEYGIKKGDWYQAVQVHNLDLRKKIESGEITGFSMEGSAMPGEPVMGIA
jgi:hypothetical protein